MAVSGQTGGNGEAVGRQDKGVGQAMRNEEGAVNVNWTRMAWIGAGVLVLALLLTRGPMMQNRLAGPEPRGEEPQVQVVVDADSGRTETMALEQYVQGVVGGEMGRLPSADGQEADWPEAAYAAQAILARTFIMAWLEDNPDRAISVDVTEAQAYRPENITPVIQRAVESTRGKVIQYKGELAKTWFHSYAGGATASAKEGLNYQDEEPGYVRSVELPENEFAPENVKAWSMSVPLNEVQAKLAEAGVNVGTLQDIKIAEFGPTERITKVTITGSGGSQTIHGAEFRLAIGPEVMKSTRVAPESFKVTDGRLVAEGTGFGHGVGLSQWDAYKMAKEGKSPEEIVKVFFQDIEIVKLWD